RRRRGAPGRDARRGAQRGRLADRGDRPLLVPLGLLQGAGGRAAGAGDGPPRDRGGAAGDLVAGGEEHAVAAGARGPMSLRARRTYASSMIARPGETETWPERGARGSSKAISAA